MPKNRPRRRARVRKIIEHIQFAGSTYTVHDEQGTRPLEKVGAEASKGQRKHEKALANLRKFRGRMPAGFKFDRDESNRRR